METKTDQSGQAILEYVMLLAIILSISGVLIGGVRATRDKMWKRMLCEVAPPCPTCVTPDSVKKALPSAKVDCKN